MHRYLNPLSRVFTGCDNLNKPLEVIIENNIAKITLNRPDVHNAFNDELIAELVAVFEDIAGDADKTRAVVLTGKGKSFCAGADLNWMKKARDYTLEENYADSKRLAKMFIFRVFSILCNKLSSFS